jgi:hypothetical protein
LLSTGIQTDGKGRVLLEVITPPLLSQPASTVFAKIVFVIIAKKFGELELEDDSKCFIYVHAVVLRTVIKWLSAHRAVHRVAPVFRFSYHNRIANEILQAGAEETKTPVWDIGIFGSRQIVGVGDTGADRRNCYLSGEQKFIMYRNISGGDLEDGSGHGTHVCGSLAGDSTEGVSNGVAKHAQIAFTDLGGVGGSFRTPANLGDAYYKYAYEAGARIHTDSWGRADFTYSSQAREVDNFLYEHEFFTALVSVGNYGACVHAAYCGSFNSVVSPASAKNTIAVGATKSTYSTFPSYIDRLTWDIKIKGQDSLHWEHHLIRGISANFALNHPVETKDVLLYPGYACDDSYTTNVTGKIVLVQRGMCSFVQKAINVQKHGASALIVMNNEQCRFLVMQGNTTEVRIPVIAIPQKDAILISALLAATFQQVFRYQDL